MSFLSLKYVQYFPRTSCLLLCKAVCAIAGWASGRWNFSFLTSGQESASPLPVPDLCGHPVARVTFELYHILMALWYAFICQRPRRETHRVRCCRCKFISKRRAKMRQTPRNGLFRGVLIFEVVRDCAVGWSKLIRNRLPTSPFLPP